MRLFVLGGASSRKPVPQTVGLFNVAEPLNVNIELELTGEARAVAGLSALDY